MPKTTTKKKTATKQSQANTTTKKKTTKKKGTTKKTAKKNPPKVHKEFRTELRTGKNALTYDEAKEILGWEAETEDVKFEKNYVCKIDGVKIRMKNNCTNRGFEMGLARKYMQEHLRKKWHFNGQALIIGEYGNTLSAQHRLTGFIMAVDEWRKDKSKYPEWKSEPKMECLIVYGVSENDEIVNTIDTGKPRTLADVIYRSLYFSDTEPNQRKELARMTEHAIKLLWDRTGAKNNAYCPDLFRTHSEAIDFLNRHDRVLECVRHIYEEKDCRTVIKSPGLGAGLLYLMGCCNSSIKKYQEGEPPSESLLDWEYWDTAQDFWVSLAQNVESMQSVRKALSKIEDDEETPLTQNARTAIVIKAWNQYVRGESASPADLKLDYSQNEEGEKVLDDFPTVGGIDLGKEDYDPVVDDAPEEDEVQQEAKKIREEKRTKTNGKKFHKGDSAYVIDDEGGHWKCELVEDAKGDTVAVKVAQGFAGAGSVVEVDYDSLTDKNPTA